MSMILLLLGPKMDENISAASPSYTLVRYRTILPVFPALSGCHGGIGWGVLFGCGAPGRVREALLQSSSTKSMACRCDPRPMRRSLRIVVFCRHYNIFFIEAGVPLWRNFSFSHSKGVVSGVIVGGQPHQSCDEDEGPDCFLEFCLRDLFVNAKNHNMITNRLLLFLDQAFINRWQSSREYSIYAQLLIRRSAANFLAKWPFPLPLVRYIQSWANK
jgi:hypothetical protein